MDVRLRTKNGIGGRVTLTSDGALSVISGTTVMLTKDEAEQIAEMLRAWVLSGAGDEPETT